MVKPIDIEGLRDIASRIDVNADPNAAGVRRLLLAASDEIASGRAAIAELRRRDAIDRICGEIAA